MSRHSFQHEQTTWVLGWDHPTATYFAQRENTHHELDDITGTHIGQHTQLASMLTELHDPVTVPDNIAAKLEQEAPAHTGSAIHTAQQRRDDLTAELRRAAAVPPVPASGPIGVQR